MSKTMSGKVLAFAWTIAACGGSGDADSDTDVAASSSESEAGEGSTGGNTGTGSASGGETHGESGSGSGGAEASRVLYLHFDGGTFVAGPEDATRDQPGNVAAPGPFAPAPAFVDRATIVATVGSALFPFDVAVTDVRPTQGDYDMVVFTESPGGAGIAAAIPDCGDVNPRNLGVVYASGNTALEASATLAIFGQTIGLELTDGDDAMAQINHSATEYDDACVPLAMPSACMHPGCPAGQQNAFAELLATVGPKP